MSVTDQEAGLDAVPKRCVEMVILPLPLPEGFEAAAAGGGGGRGGGGGGGGGGGTHRGDPVVARARVRFTVSGERRSWARLVALIFREPSGALVARERAPRARGECWSVSVAAAGEPFLLQGMNPEKVFFMVALLLNVLGH